MSRPTLADVARQAGVGVATVDRVINGRAPVRPETSQRVLEAAQAIGFRATGLIRARIDQRAGQFKLGFILQRRSAPFYSLLADALTDATRASSAIQGQPVVEFLNELTPQAVAEALLSMGSRVDALAVVAADHPKVRDAIEQLNARGIPVITLLTDLSATHRVSYIGIDNRRAGRTAAWTISRLSKAPGKVAILVGSHRYQCQELCEVSFRSYFRENAPKFQIVDDLISLEDPALAQEATFDLLQRHPDLVGIYVAGGGAEGVISALRDNPATRSIITVCNELTDQTQSALVDGIIDLVISHPRDRLAATAVQAMIDALEGRSSGGSGNEQSAQHLLPFDIHIAENV
uniref:LacI family DNA-binding transcriptional regulator n=1 Tax=Marinobacterium profundum TaxID=1714300 RepID=UPI0008372C4F|nr:LacI family DNA-binding transcriptional regulator [Marinobacterium profundum]